MTFSKTPTGRLPPTKWDQKPCLAKIQKRPASAAKTDQFVQPISSKVDQKVAIQESKTLLLYAKQEVEKGDEILVNDVVIKAGDRKKIRKEANVLKRLKKVGAPHVIELIASFEGVSFGCPKEHVLLLKQGGLSLNLLENLSLLEIRTIATQCFETLQFLKSCQVVHGNFQPSNILFDRATQDVQIIGWSSCSKTPAPIHLCYTPLKWRDPIFFLKPPTYDGSVDIWSLGCTLFALATGKPPFYSREETQYGVGSIERYKVQFGAICAGIGFPTVAYMNKGQNKGHFSKVTEKPEVSWDSCVRESLSKKGENGEKITSFISMLQGIFVFENRPSPDELLQCDFIRKK